MKEILIAILIPQIILLPFYFAIRNGRRKQEDDDPHKDGTEIDMVDAEKVLTIVKGCYLDLKRQKANTRAPWIESLLEGPLHIQYDEKGRIHVRVSTKSISPGVALSAITMTIHEILATPISYDKDGMEMPRRVVNLDGLNKAKDELMEMMGEGE